MAAYPKHQRQTGTKDVGIEEAYTGPLLGQGYRKVGSNGTLAHTTFTRRYRDHVRNPGNGSLLRNTSVVPRVGAKGDRYLLDTGERAYCSLRLSLNLLLHRTRRGRQFDGEADRTTSYPELFDHAP